MRACWWFCRLRRRSRVRPIVEIVVHASGEPLSGVEAEPAPCNSPRPHIYLLVRYRHQPGSPAAGPLRPGEDLRLIDDHESERTVRILDVASRSALVEYRPRDG